MHISHPFVKSEIYELIKMVEFEVAIGEEAFLLRVELLRTSSTPPYFRAHIWRREFFNLQSSFPQDAETHEPVDSPSAEMIFADYSYQFSRDYSHFQAESETAALQLVLDDFHNRLKHMAGE